MVIHVFPHHTEDNSAFGFRGQWWYKLAEWLEDCPIIRLHVGGGRQLARYQKPIH